MPPPTEDPRLRQDLEAARRAVLVRRPLHWEVAATLIAALERAWLELDPPKTERSAEGAPLRMVDQVPKELDDQKDQRSSIERRGV